MQADLFKLQCVKQVILQSPVINTDSDAYACLSSFLCTDKVISKNKKSKQKQAWTWKGYWITANQIEQLVLSCQNHGMGKIGIKNHGNLTAIDLCCILNGRSCVSWVFATDYLGHFYPDFGVPINNMRQIFKNVCWVKKEWVIHG